MQGTWKRFLAEVLPAEWLDAQDQEPCFLFETREGRAEWEPLSSEEEGDALREVYRAADMQLRLNVEVTRLPDRGVFVARMRLTNTADERSPEFTELLPLRIGWQSESDDVRVRRVGGGRNEWLYPPRAFRVETVRCLGRCWFDARAGEDGRSSNRHLPLLAVQDGKHGLVTALEWSGIWHQDFIGGPGAACGVTGGAHLDGLTLERHESLDMPPVHYIYTEGGLDAAGNACRHYIRECICPRTGEEPPEPKLVYNHWFNLGPDIDQESMLAQADAAAEAGAECFVLDAGWYGGCREGDFQSGVGNWEVIDTDKFPDGIRPLADYVREKGMKFGIWFEPERAHRDSHWAREHPDWFWDVGREYLHINLCRQDAQEGVVRVISETIDRLGAEWIKIDYNLGPARYWQKVDPSGKTMFRYVEGLYRVLDELVERNSQVIFECCASGGRRIDFGTLRRSHTAFLSDHVHHSAICRFMQTGASHFLPANVNSTVVPSGPGPTTFNWYDAACRLLGAYSYHGDMAAWDEETAARAARMSSLYKSIRPLLLGDFHRLLRHPVDDSEWDAVQFSDRGAGRSLVAVFSFRGPQRTMRIRLRGLTAEAQYAIYSLLPARKALGTTRGEKLLTEGVAVKLGPESAAFLLVEPQPPANS